MTLDEAIKRYTNNAKYERTDGSLQGCLEFKQLAEWLKDYKRLKEQEPCEDCISRQAVLKIIDGWYDNNRDTENIEDLIVLITYMGSVNPQKPICPSAGVDCEDCPAYEDTISRKAVIDTLERMDKALDEDRTVESYKELLRECYKVLPSVSKPKTGHWVFDEVIDRHYYCSECKSMGVDYWDYCPNCGAKMVEEDKA